MTMSKSWLEIVNSPGYKAHMPVPNTTNHLTVEISLPDHSDRQTEDGKAVSHGSSSRAPKPMSESHAHPTRYGDWEKAGRCIDF